MVSFASTLSLRPALPWAASVSALPTLPGRCAQPVGARRKSRETIITVVACAHILGVWALLQTHTVRSVVQQRAPLTVTLLTAEPPTSPLPPAPATPKPSSRPLPSAPLAATQPTAAPNLGLAAPPAPLAPTSVFVAEPQPPAAQPAATVAVAATLLAPPTPLQPATAPTAAPRKVLAATAVRYLLEPPVEVPRASRRAGEHGVVTLRVVVSPLGLPLQVTVWRSSGYVRLDEQALWAMRQARFQPHTEDGRALEVEVMAPIEYPAD